MRKWALTIILAAAAGVATWLSRWPPHVWHAAVANRESIGLATDLMSWVLWIAAALSALLKAWAAKERLPGQQDEKITAITDGRAGRDQIAAGGDVQTGGVRIEGPLRGDAAGRDIIRGDMVGRDKIEGDAVAGDKVEGDKIQIIQQAAAVAGVAPLHQLPSPPGDFTGREEELGELRSALDAGGVAISGVTGMGGVGKTVLALKLADELKDRYPDAQFYLDLLGTSDQPMSPARAMTYVLQGFHPDAKLPESEAELRSVYCSVLDGKRALLLMDNAADARQVTPLIPPASCVLLVTSRRHFTLPGLYVENLDVLPPGDARELLLRIEPRISEQADEIARLCGYLPLALRAAGSLLAVTPDLDPAAYAQALRDERQRLERIGTEGVDVSVEACFGLTYQRLPDDAAAVFRKLAVFPGSFHAAAEEAVCEDAAHRRLSELVRWSLVQWDEKSKRYRLHDLVRLFAESRLAESEGSTAQRRHAEHYKAVLAAADDLYLKGSDGVLRGLELYDRDQANVQAGQRWAAARRGEEAVAQLSSDYGYAGMYVLDLRLHPRERITWLEAALDAARRLKNHPAEGSHLGNLGNAYFELGETHKAIELYEQALAVMRDIGDRRGEGNALGNLGTAYAALGDTRKAIELYEQRLKIAREIGDRRGEGTAFWNMSLALDKLGQRKQAIANAEAALAIREQIEDPAAEKVRRQLAEWRKAK